MSTLEIPDNLPKAWRNLFDGLALLARAQSNEVSPFHCSHDQLTVMADPAGFSSDELAHLGELGFTPGRPGTEDEGTFTSSRFGSA